MAENGHGEGVSGRVYVGMSAADDLLTRSFREHSSRVSSRGSLENIESHWRKIGFPETESSWHTVLGTAKQKPANRNGGLFIGEQLADIDGLLTSTVGITKRHVMRFVEVSARMRLRT